MRKLVLILSLFWGGAAFADSFGALSYSPSTGSAGSAWNYSCADEAQRSAKGWCGQADCENPVWVQNGCAALASGNNAAHYAWAWGSDRGLVMDSALSRCAQDDAGCRVISSVCSF